MANIAYGGVLVNSQQQILLRETAGGYGDYLWTYAKGGGEGSESPEETALREVQEETGMIAKIIARIPGEFKGTTSVTIFYLMEVVKNTGIFNRETAQIKWVTFEE